jgi:CheY-like chemotaxis protein
VAAGVIRLPRSTGGGPNWRAVRQDTRTPSGLSRPAARISLLFRPERPTSGDSAWREMAAVSSFPSREAGTTEREGSNPMPAAVLVVHDERSTRELAVSVLRAAFLDAVEFADPIAALEAIEANSHVRVLVTRVMFGPNKLDGIALARMVRFRRPGTKVVFVAADYAPQAEGLGVFLPMPLNPDIFVATVGRLLVARDDDREIELSPDAWNAANYRARAAAWRDKATIVPEDSRERSICQSIAQGHDNLAEIIEERDHLSQAPQRETEDLVASEGPPPPAG